MTLNKLKAKNKGSNKFNNQKTNNNNSDLLADQNDISHTKSYAKINIMDKKNKGVAERDEYDKSLMQNDNPTENDVTVSLEKKAELYDKIINGNSGMLKMASDKYLVDFDRAAAEKLMSDKNYEKDRSSFYKKLQGEAMQRENTNKDLGMVKHSELGEHFNTLERQRIQWEREALETLNEEEIEMDSLKKRFYIRQRYDMTLSKEEKEKLKIVKEESQKEKSRLEEIKFQKVQANKNREEKLKRLKKEFN